jgi:hypothetical protein
VRREVEEKRAAELQFDASHRKPLPDFKRFNATVKLNAAAILREDALFKKKQEAEAKLIQNYEEELRDSTEYYRWKTEMEEHDNQMKMEQVKLKRMQAVASGQNARDALERQYLDNKAVAELIKEEGSLMSDQVRDERSENERSRASEAAERAHASEPAERAKRAHASEASAKEGGCLGASETSTREGGCLLALRSHKRRRLFVSAPLAQEKEVVC